MDSVRNATRSSGLTQFWCFAEDEGVCPELADGPVVKALVTDGPLQPFGHQDVHHEAPSTDGTEYTARAGGQRRRMKKRNHGMCFIHYLRIEIAEGYVLIAVYLFIYLYACSSHNTRSIKPNRM